MRHLGGPVIADVRAQGRHQHQRFVEQFIDPFPVGLDPGYQVVGKTHDRVGKKPDGLEQAVYHHRFEHIEFKISLGPGKAHRDVIADDPCDHHGHGLALGGIHLSRHDGTSRFIGRDPDLPDPATGSAGQPADVVGDLHETARNGFRDAAGLHDGVMSGQSFELVVRRLKGKPGDPGDFLRRQGVKTDRGIETRPHGGAPQGNPVKVPKAVFGPLHAEGDLFRIAGKFLSQRDGRGVLQVGPADLHDSFKGRHLFVQRLFQMGKGGNQLMMDRFRRRDVHGGGKRVVG